MSGRYPLPVDERFNEKVTKTNDGCWLFNGMGTANGYGLFSVKRKVYTAHRFAWILRHGEIPEGMEVCHKCDVRRCVNPEHLFVGTRLDNMMDCVSKGRQQRGAGHYAAKLDPKTVQRIRELAGTTSQLNLASEFHVSQQTISRVIRGNHWSDSK